MALIDCGECQKQVSDKAKACPNCGAPIADEAINEVQTIQQTSKALKAQVMIAAVVTAFGLALAITEGGTGAKPEDAWGGVVFLIGLIWMIVSYFRIWWNHR